MSEPALIARRLFGDRPADVRDVQRVLREAPDYSRIVTGKPPGDDAAREVFDALPADARPADKFVLGWYAGPVAAGCADVLRGYPEAHIAYIGLLIFSAAFQGRSLGPRALADVSARARRWRCRSLRLAVIDRNTRALAFWRREGFVEIYRKPVAGFLGEAIVMERALGATAR